ncbi:MAG TPA: DUF3108 domain-containing protein [Candidatus Eisenbacteria bacterium]|nr:DUF3108 domain-containing protein [Candidatus Eisenbacteria bacterium]
MGKRLLQVLLLAVVVLAAAYFAYRYFGARRPLPNAAPSNTGPSIRTKPVTPAPGTESGAKNPESKGPEAGKAASPAPLGFIPRSGEVLEFAANVTKLNSTVATLQVKVGDRRTFEGKSAWHLQAFAHTENPYRMVFELDDQFDSYSTAPNFESLQYELHLSERGQKADVVERMISSNSDPAPTNATAARVLPGTRDPIGFLMYLRSRDWDKTKEVRSPVFDGHKLYDVRAVLLARNQPVSVTAGKFTTTKIEIHVLDNGAEMKDAHFLLYLTEDQQLLPVLMEAVLPVATARVELTKVH